ncbi:MAG: hypothetical protein IJN42_03000 [Clostridia bacterium]|nr:hypothetical protein [Clostridia bacterium]
MNPTPQQPDYIALAMVIVLALIVVGMVIRKWLSNRAAAKAPAPAPAAKVPAAPAPGTAGQIKLNGVDPKIAAMLMAMVAEEVGKPLCELRFISIEEVKE